MEVKTINICGIEVPMEASFGVNDIHFRTFNKKFKGDISELLKATETIKQSESVEEVIEQMESIDDMIDVAFRLGYSMAKCYNEEISDYKKWVKQFDPYSTDPSWIGEVTELAVTTFPRPSAGSQIK